MALDDHFKTEQTKLTELGPDLVDGMGQSKRATGEWPTRRRLATGTQ